MSVLRQAELCRASVRTQQLCSRHAETHRDPVCPRHYSCSWNAADSLSGHGTAFPVSLTVGI